jgi:hypothetical protein
MIAAMRATMPSLQFKHATEGRKFNDVTLEYVRDKNEFRSALVSLFNPSDAAKAKQTKNFKLFYRVANTAEKNEITRKNEVKNRRFSEYAKSNAGQLTGAATRTVRNPGSAATGVQKRPTVGERPQRNPNLGKKT